MLVDEIRIEDADALSGPSAVLPPNSALLEKLQLGPAQIARWC